MSGLESVAAALQELDPDLYCPAGRGHKWEDAVKQTGLPPQKIAEALRSPKFNKGNARTPILTIQRAAGFARSAAADKSKAEPTYNWRDGALDLKPTGHRCDRDATCNEHYGFYVKTADGSPIVLCAYHYLADVPKYLNDAFMKVVEPRRQAHSIWADEVAQQFEQRFTNIASDDGVLV